MENVKKILKDLQMNTPDVQGSTLMTNNGSILSTLLPDGLEGDKIRETAFGLFSLGEETAQQLRRGTIDTIFIKGEEGYVVFTNLGGMGILTTLASKKARIGLIFSDIDRASTELTPLLQGLNPGKKNILFVDDEEPFLLSLSDGLSTYYDDFNVLTALNGKEAVKILNSTKVDLVVTDLKMPVMDGYELLAYMSRNYPDVSVIVMTAYGTPEAERWVKNLSIARYLEKPLDFNVLADNIFDALSASSSQGYIQGIALVSFLQLVEMDKKTCTLTIRSRGKVGRLYFSKGELMDAEGGVLKGEAAALDIITWENAEIEIAYICKIKKRNIAVNLTEILMEGCRIKDEKGYGEKGRGGYSPHAKRS